MAYREQKIKLPATGTFTITGETGSGKSTLIECICWAGWGRTARGNVSDDPIRDGETAGGVQLLASTHKVVRERAGKKETLIWNRKGEPAEEWATRSKAEQALEKELGSFEAWYWTHVFSSIDLGFFVGSRDDERKRFLEELLGVGVEVFAPGHKRADKDLKEADAALKRVDLELTALEAKVTTLREERGDPPEEPTFKRVSPSKIKEARERLSTVAAQHADLNNAHSRDLGALRQQHRQLVEWVTKMADGVCPTCKQEIDVSLLKATKKKATKAEEAISEAVQAHDLSEVEGVIFKARALIKEITTREEAWGTYDRARAEWDGRDARADKLAVQLTAKSSERSALIDRVEQCRESVQALSIGGVRSWAVADSLEAITDAANDYLAILSPTIQIEMKAYSELKNGTNDKISLKVKAAGGGKYKMVSQGETQQIALAVRLAIAALRNDRGTLFFDEAFGSISGGNQERVVEFIQELSQDRCVVVITHDLRMAKLLGSLGGKSLHLA